MGRLSFYLKVEYSIGMKVSQMIRISRPRFWLYELGTFAVGVCIGLSVGGQVNLLFMILFGLLFLFPANFFIYGVNDVFDYETDRLNPKKMGYEDVLPPAVHKKVLNSLFWINVPFVVLGLFIPWKAFISLLLFYFFAFFYSAPPIRAKARPFLDSLFSASHYVVTAVCGYYLVGGSGGIALPVCAGICWAVAMHAYSAVPDIDADRESGIQTIAIALGKKATILLCGFLYVLAGIIVLDSIGYSALVLVVPYVTLMYLSYNASESRLFKLYTYFPYLNAGVGMILFFIFLFRI